MKNFTGFKFFVLFCIGFFVQLSAFGATKYVAAGGLGTGISWASPYGDIQTAINSCSSGDMVWVKSGIFSPSTAIVLKEGVQVYGGFVGTEAALSDRNLVTTPKTTLSGSFAHRLFTQSADFTTLTIVDGFSIVNGVDVCGGGVLLKGNGALSNCLIANNKATNTASGNNLLAGGGAIYLDGAAIIVNCLIANNEAEYGGAINMRNGATVINSTLVNNKAVFASGTNGRGIWAADATVKIYNSVLWGNVVGAFGEIALNGAPDVQNCATDDGVDYNNSLAHFDFNIPSSNTPSIFVSPNVEKGIIPSFNLSRIGDFTLATGSVLIDAGSNGLVSALPASLQPQYIGTIDVGYSQAKAPVHIINITINDKVYDGIANASFLSMGALNTADILPGDIGNVSLITTGITSLQFASANASLIPQAVTITGNYSLTGTAASKYVVVQPTGLSATISAKAITITPNAGQFKFFGDPDPAEILHTTAPAIVTGDTYSKKLIRVAGETIGTYQISQSGLMYSSNYVESFTSGVTFEIKPRVVTITVTANQSKIYGATDPVLAYSISGLSSGHTASNVVVRSAGESAGFYTITQPVGFKILDGSSVDVTNQYQVNFVGANFEVKKKSITVTATDNSKIYGASDPTLNYSLSTPLIGGDAINGLLSRVVGENKGVYDINQGTLAINSNYTITFVKGKFTINAKTIVVTPNANQSKVYGAADPVYGYTWSPALVGADSFTGSLGRLGGENVDSYAFLQGSLALNSNYSLIISPEIFTITKLDIAITVDAGQSKIYGDADPVFSFTSIPDLIVGDSWAGALTRVTGNTLGDYAISIGTLAPNSPSASPSTGNYNVTSFTGNSFKITARELTMDAAVKVNNKAYDKLDTAYMTKGNLVGIAYSDDVDYKVVLAHFADNLVGTNKPVTVSFALTGISAPNYTLTPKTGFFADITAIDLRNSSFVSAAPVTKVYDGSKLATVPAITVSGVLPGDVLTATGTSATFNSKHVGTNKTVTVRGIIYSGSNLSNYILPDSTTNTSSEIKVMPLSPSIYVEVDTSSQEYHGSAAAVVPSLTVKGVVAGDVVIATSNSASFNDKNVGSKNKTLVVDNILFSGADASNYTILNTAQNSGCSITPKALNLLTDLVVTPLTKVYDGSSAVGGLSLILNGLYPTDAVSMTNSSALLDSKNVGSRTLSISGISLLGTDAANYSVSSSTTRSFTVSPLPLGTATINFANQSKVYDASNVVPSFPTLTVGGLVTGDVVTATATAASYGSANVGSTSLTVSAISYSGADVSNYTLPTSVVNNACTITPFNVTVTPASGLGNELGSSEEPLIFTILPAILPNNESLFGVITREAGTTVGNYEILPGTLTEANNSNYHIIFTTGVFYDVFSSVELRVKWGNILVVNNSAKNYKSFQWYKDGNAVVGQTLPYYAIDANLCGVYRLEVKLANGSTLISADRKETNCSVIKNYSIYPTLVPSAGNLSIQKDGDDLKSTSQIQTSNSEDVTIAIYSIDGVQVSLVNALLESHYSFEAPDTRGSYIVVISNESGVVLRQKVVVY